MNNTTREALAAFGLLCVLSGALGGRARHAMWRLAHTEVGPVNVTTRVDPSGVLGFASGRAAVARMRTVGGSLDQIRLAPTATGNRFLARARLLILAAEQCSVLGVENCSARLAVRNAVLDGDALLWRARGILVSTGPGEAVITVSAADAAALVRRRLRSEAAFSVGCAAGRVCITGGMPSDDRRFVLMCTPVVKGGREVALSDPQLWVDGRAVPESLGNMMLAAVNPILRLDEMDALADRCEIAEVRIGEGSLSVVLSVLPTQKARKKEPTTHE